MTPSLMKYDRRPRKGKDYSLIVIILGVLFLGALCADKFILTPDVVQAAPKDTYHEWDRDMCSHLDRYVNGNEPHVIAYCKDHD